MKTLPPIVGLAVAMLAAPATGQVFDEPYQTIEGEAPRPHPPAGAAPTLRLPARDAAGRWTTPNRDLSPAAAVWHVRAALNVAALGCRGPHDAERVAAYNAFITGKAALLSTSEATERAEYRTRHGAQWQPHQDGDMTRLYNFFAQPNAQAAFCAEADAVLAEVGAADAGAYQAMAAGELARLEAPFIAFYDRYAGYHAALEAWNTRNLPPQVMVASAATANMVAIVQPR